MRSLTLALLLVFTVVPASAQCTADCGSAEYYCGLRLGQQLTAPCDSMVVLNQRTFERAFKEAAQRARLLELTDRAHGQAASMLATQDSLLAVHQHYIRALEEHEQVLQRLNQQLTTRLDASIQNTERAVAIARRNRTLGIVLGGAAGTVVGLLVGGALF